MKWFLGTVCGLMVFVVVVVVLLFVYVQVVLAPPETGTRSPTTAQPVLSSSQESDGLTATSTQSANDDVSITEIPPEPEPLPPPVVAEPQPIPLSSLPRSETQKKILTGVGIDPETFIITPAMTACANEKLGAVRMKEIIGGSAPLALEMASLMRCL